MGRRGEERNSVKFNAWPPTPTFHQSLFLKGQQCTLRTNKVIFFRNRFDDACVKVSGCFLLWWSSNPILLYIRQKLLMSSFLTPLQPFSQRFFCAQKAQFSVKGLGRWLKGLDDMLFDFLYLLILKWEGRKNPFSQRMWLISNSILALSKSTTP